MEQFPLPPARPASLHRLQNAQFSWSLAAFYTTFDILPIISPDFLKPSFWLVKRPRLVSTPAASIKMISDSGDFYPLCGPV